MYTLSQFVSRSKTIHSCDDSRTTSLPIEVNEYSKSLSKLKKKKYQNNVNSGYY
jgi:hypothetical protein